MTSALPSKAQLRSEGLARREALDAAWRDDASRRIAAHLAALPELGARSPVAFYWPIRSEVDPRAAAGPLVERGVTLALPVVAEPTLLFRRWVPGDALERGGFGLHEPGAEAPVVDPAALLLPLSRFDRRGNRIGYGKGHYDRALERLDAGPGGPVLVIGLAFGVQEAERIPAEPHDRPLDFVVTEAGVIRTR